MKDSTPNPLEWIDGELDTLDRQGLRRQLAARSSPQSVRMTLDGRELINFGSNDYLGLAAEGRLAAAVARAVAEEGWGSGASPLVTGRSSLHARLEQRLAEMEGTEAALLFPSGYAANVGAIVRPGRTGRRRLHRPQEPRQPDGRLPPLPGHVRPIRTAIGRRWTSCWPGQKHGRRLIVTDSLFSMDGDFAPLVELSELAARHGAMLLIDEAHATGVFGRHGRGVAEHLGVEDRIASAWAR